MTTPTAQTPHTHRANAYKHAPDLYQAMLALDAAAKKDLDPILVELVRVRASQINHCAFCLDMHTTAALEAGEQERRLHLIAAWPEAGNVFTDKERAALALTEAITLLTEGFVPDEVYDRALAEFGEDQLARLIANIVAINAWNRIAVTTRRVPPAHPKA